MESVKIKVEKGGEMELNLSQEQIRKGHKQNGDQ